MKGRSEVAKPKTKENSRPASSLKQLSDLEFEKKYCTSTDSHGGLPHPGSTDLDLLIKLQYMGGGTLLAIIDLTKNQNYSLHN